MSKPKVLRILNRFNIGGPILNAALLSKHLAPEFETMLVGGPNELHEKNAFHILDDLGLDHQIIPHMGRAINPIKDYKAYREIEDLILDFKPDIVHTHASKAGALGRLAADRNKVKHIVHTFHGHVFHGYFPKWKTNLYKSIERHLASKSDHIITISESQSREIINDHHIVSSHKSSIIPLGFDLSKFFNGKTEKRQKFRKEFNVSDNTIAIGIIGRLAPIKNHGLFIDALDHLKQNTTKDWQAYIVGDGECRNEIEQKVTRLGLSYSDKPDASANIIFTSFRTDIDHIMAGMDIIALTSKNEGTPVSLIEAQAAGKAIVSTDVGGVQNIVSPGNTAVVTPLCHPNAFYQGLTKLVNNPDLRKRFALNGPGLVREKFHYSRLVKDVRELYLKLLAG